MITGTNGMLNICQKSQKLLQTVAQEVVSWLLLLIDYTYIMHNSCSCCVSQLAHL